MVFAAPAAHAVIPQDLAHAVAAYDAATVSNDVARLNEIVRDDYLLVNSDMSIQGKASYLADFKVPGFKINHYRLSEPILRIRADSALTGGYLHLRWTQGGQSFDRRLRIIHFWVKDRGQWRLAYTQLTRRPEPS
jgi:ketosteroid isomerase-like protein